MVLRIQIRSHAFLPELFLQPTNVVFEAVSAPVLSGSELRGAHSIPSNPPFFSRLEETNTLFILFHKMPFYHSYKNDWCLSVCSFAVMKTMTKSKLEGGKKGLFQVIEGSQGRISARELKQRT